MTETEIKAAIYDELVKIEEAQKRVAELNAELRKIISIRNEEKE